MVGSRSGQGRALFHTEGLSAREAPGAAHALHLRLPNNCTEPFVFRRSRQSLAAAALALAALSSAAPLAAQVDTLDGPRRPLFTWRDVTFIGGMIALTGAISPLDKSIADHLQDSTVQANRFFGNVASVVRTVADPGAV